MKACTSCESSPGRRNAWFEYLLIRHYVSKESWNSWWHHSSSRLDYCNAILAGLPASTLMPLQCAQNAAARSSTRAPHHLQSRNSDSPSSYNRRCPPYLADLVAFSSTDSHRQLRSTTTRVAANPARELGPSSEDWEDFSVCGPEVWNSLPPSVRTVDYSQNIGCFS